MIRAAVTVREFEQAVEMLKFTKKHFEDHLDQLIGLKRWAEKNYNTFKDNDLENEDFLRQLIRSKLNVLFDDVSKEEVKALNTYIRNFGSVKQFAKQKLIELSPHWCLYIYLEYACDEVVGPYSKMTFTKAQQICRVLFEDKENTEEQIFIDRSLRIRELTHDKSYINCEDAGEIEYSLRTIKLSKDFLKHHIDPCTPLPEKEDPITKKTSKLNSKQKKFMMDKLTADKVKFEIQRKRFREYVRKFNTDLLEHEADINEDPMVIADQLCKYYCITLQTIPILFWRLGHRSSLTQTSKNSTKASRRNLRQQFSPTKPKRFHDKFKTIKPPKKVISRFFCFLYRPRYKRATLRVVYRRCEDHLCPPRTISYRKSTLKRRSNSNNVYKHDASASG